MHRFEPGLPVSMGNTHIEDIPSRVSLLSGGARVALRAGRQLVPEDRGNAQRSPLGIPTIPICVCRNWVIVTLNFTTIPGFILWSAISEARVRTGSGSTRFVSNSDLHTR